MKRFFGGALIIIVFLLGGCSDESTVEPTPLVTTTPNVSMIEPRRSTVVASGVIVPEQRLVLGVVTPARVESVQVEVGDRVEVGQVLITLDGSEQQDAALAAAQLELLRAEQSFAALLEDAPYTAAQAMLELANARDALHNAQRILTYQTKGNRATRETLEATRAQLVLAERGVERAQARYKAVKHKNKHDPEWAAARVTLEEARRKRDAIQATLNWYTGELTDIDRSKLEADVEVALERVAHAEMEWEKWKDGPDAESLAIAEAHVTYANAQLTAAEDSLRDCQMVSPFQGTITSVEVSASEIIMPGQPMITLADLDTFLVETIDLSERDVGELEIGNPAIVTIEPLHISLSGQVERIALEADTIGGDVVYGVWIALDEQPEGIRWGMSVEVEIEPINE